MFRGLGYDLGFRVRRREKDRNWIEVKDLKELVVTRGPTLQNHQHDRDSVTMTFCTEKSCVTKFL